MKIFYTVILVLIFIRIDFYIFPRIFKLLFPRKGDFIETVRVGFRPDIISLFKGEYWKDQASEFMLSVLLFFYTIAILLEYFAIKIIIKLCGF